MKNAARPIMNNRLTRIGKEYHVGKRKKAYRMCRKKNSKMMRK